MKTTVLFALVLSLFLSFAGASYAEGTDMAKFPCKDFAALPQTNAEALKYTIFWVDGYLSAESEDTTIDEEWLATLTKNMLTYCSANPGKTVMDAMQNLPQ